MKNTSKKDGKAKIAKAITGTNNGISTFPMLKNGVYDFKTPAIVRKKNKVIYLVHYHQFALKGSYPSFPEMQMVEFTDPNPLIARRKAFEYAKSRATYPDGKPFDYSDSKPSKSISSQKKGELVKISRWCAIICGEYGKPTNIVVYSEPNVDPTPAFLEGLSSEVEVYEQLGFGNLITTSSVIDTEGNTHRIIEEGLELGESKLAS